MHALRSADCETFVAGRAQPWGIWRIRHSKSVRIESTEVHSVCVFAPQGSPPACSAVFATPIPNPATKAGSGSSGVREEQTQTPKIRVALDALR
eukprot:8944255-Alexandrium_andersonii.AAC.1